MFKVDLNCDMGESFGAYRMGRDEEILNYVSSVNIACGFHAGDPSTMRKTVKLALEKNVGIGAHPGFQDLVGFGRREMSLTPKEINDLVLYQIGALSAFVKAEGGKLAHVKPHGALYNMAAKNAALSDAIAEAIYQVDPELILFGLAGSELINSGEKIGLHTASEVFSDRTYQQDGSLTPRKDADALITDPKLAVGQVLKMVLENKVKTVQGTDFIIQADTVCIHGDGEHAVEVVQFISAGLEQSGVKVSKISG
ncbi:LamB/YcsF family protein [Peribacillus loiseleuriae]|uniref:LamB/YcsF family protein n=1 Tax=Peribacillus loiseleuriae TaxID=1679170 RepID=UPI0037F3FBBC